MFYCRFYYPKLQILINFMGQITLYSWYTPRKGAILLLVIFLSIKLQYFAFPHSRQHLEGSLSRRSLLLPWLVYFHYSARLKSFPGTGTCVDVCSLPLDPGPCIAIIPAWGAVLGTCIEWTYGGCKGNGNRFLTQEECLYKCFDIIVDDVLL